VEGLAYAMEQAVKLILQYMSIKVTMWGITFTYAHIIVFDLSVIVIVALLRGMGGD
jgi:hypothetical protein